MKPVVTIITTVVSERVVVDLRATEADLVEDAPIEVVVDVVVVDVAFRLNTSNQRRRRSCRGRGCRERSCRRSVWRQALFIGSADADETTIAPVDDCAGPEIECRRFLLRLDRAGELIETLGEAERAPGQVRVDERLDIRTGHNGHAFAKALGWDRPR